MPGRYYTYQFQEVTALLGDLLNSALLASHHFLFSL